MLDGISLDQLRTFSTAVEEGSRLKVLSIEAVPADGLPLPMSVVYPSASPPGPADRWFVRFLQEQPPPTRLRTL